MNERATEQRFRLTPTGNPLTEEQIEEWRVKLLRLSSEGMWFPAGAQVLCDMAKAALRLAPSAVEGKPEETSEERRLRHRLEKIDAVLDQLGAPKSDDWDGLDVSLSQVGRILRLVGKRRDENGALVALSETAATELERLREVEHIAWHLMEGSEERVAENEIVVSRDDYEALSKLLPEDHP